MDHLSGAQVNGSTSATRRQMPHEHKKLGAEHRLDDGVKVLEKRRAERRDRSVNAELRLQQ